MILVAVAISFATSNKAVVTLYLWPFDGMLTAPIWLAVMSSFIIGGLLSICLMWAQALAIRARLWNLQGKFNRLEAEKTPQQSLAGKHNDEQANGSLTANYTPAPNIKDQEAKTFLSEPLRTDQTLR
jgi:uncharacterized integral membrane protein